MKIEHFTELGGSGDYKIYVTLITRSFKDDDHGISMKKPCFSKITNSFQGSSVAYHN